MNFLGMVLTEAGWLALVLTVTQSHIQVDDDHDVMKMKQNKKERFRGPKL